ncbi:MAG: hypothetical protein ACRDNM_05575 [Gaiellaceae bacterium]
MKLFADKPESSAEKEALAKLDEATREVSWQEEQKVAERGHPGARLGFLRWLMPYVPFRRKRGGPVDDPDPADSRSLRDVLHEGDDEG